jgi:hypothetical protein
VKGRSGVLGLAALAILAACNSSGSSPTPTPVPLGVSCPTAAEVETTLASAFTANSLVLTAGQGTGQSADTLYCTYRAENGDDLSLQIVVGPRAPVVFSDTIKITPSNPSVTVAPLQIGDNGWVATAPAPAGGGREIVAAGTVQRERYSQAFYRYLTYPLASSSRRPAPTADETVAFLGLGLR